MADVAIVDEQVFPTQNDVGAAEGDGKLISEENLIIEDGTFSTLIPNNYIKSGFDISGLTSGNLNLSIPVGVCFINGYRVIVPNPTLITFTDASTNFLYIKLLFDGNTRATSAVYEHNITGTPPADSAFIGEVIAAGGQITSTTDFRETNPDDLAIAGDYSELIQKNTPITKTLGTGFNTFMQAIAPRGGSYSFFMHVNSLSGQGGSARIHRNNIAVGTNRAVNNTGPDYTETISGWKTGDLIQIKLRKNSAGTSDFELLQFEIRTGNPKILAFDFNFGI